MPETLGERLRRKREACGWSQAQLAAKVGSSQAVIQKIETGKTLRPRNLEALAEALVVSPVWLMFGDAPVETLDPEAIDLARSWSRLREPQRTVVKEIIDRLSR